VTAVTLPRTYGPAAVIHEADCPDAPADLLAFRARSLITTHPNGRPHVCFDRDTVIYNRLVVAEPVDYGRHVYQPSSIRPEGAERALCAICRGTHGEVPA
jgi:hypothetical protein